MRLAIVGAGIGGLTLALEHQPKSPTANDTARVRRLRRPG